MGAISFSIDKNLLDLIVKDQAFDIFVETGTFNGDTVAIAKNYFEQIYSIELSDTYYEEAKRRFIKDDKIKIIHGDAAESLKVLEPELCDKKVIFWLDAHWCVADETAGATSQCNLCEELTAIGTLHEESIIIIDDARLFLCTPPQPHEISQWPTFQSVLKSLQVLSDKHNIAIINDNIIFYPQAMENKFSEYAYKQGVDWLHYADKSKEYDILLSQLTEKEKEIEVLSNICKERENIINGLPLGIKEDSTKILQELHECKTMLAANRTIVRKILQGIKKIRNKLVSKIKVYFWPSLGRLYHYTPRELIVDKKYAKKTKLISYPKISIVTPSYNQADYIEKTINSVLDQKYPNLQYVIQDGNSADRTKDILNQYHSQLTYWESLPDTGQSNAINLGFKHTNGDIMAYLNSDDLLLPGTLHYIADFFIKNPDVNVIYGHRVLIDKNDMEIGRWILPRHSNKILRWADYVPQETLFWRRNIWEKVGGTIDENFQFAMDWDLILRFAEAGAKFKCLPRFLGAFRVHDQQKTSAVINDKGMKEMDILRERCHGRQVSRKEIRKNIRGYLLRHVIRNKLYNIGLLNIR